MTRDSRVLTVGVIIAVIMGLGTLDTQTALSYGLHANWLPYVRFVSFVVGIVCAQLGTSPLRHSSEVR